MGIIQGCFVKLKSNSEEIFRVCDITSTMMVDTLKSDGRREVHQLAELEEIEDPALLQELEGIFNDSI
ncbi:MULTISPECIES: hypothetical protein [Alistipes]|uniref:Uncharacterized protein n=1 Tax=Alistipes intestinihominis TaxID=3133172 RepID=A0ABV1GYJ6_9BACT|nr:MULTISPECIES: hypothetical protein [Alistipes]MBQ7892884.1 hypothetical protein [Alistipes sp.]MBR2217601.1 hypothetical protein [Alistipes sp.]